MAAKMIGAEHGFIDGQWPGADLQESDLLGGGAPRQDLATLH